ncbi:MAG: ATP-binding protein [Archangium sp.]|nr:ATP-binding protein [Archangium sp.]
MSARSVAAVQTRVEVLAFAAAARTLAATEGVEPRHAMELSLVIAELGMNALRHGGGCGLVTVSVCAQGWSVEVEDTGRGLSAAVIADAGQSDHLGPDGVRPPGDGLSSFGSGLASVRRMSSRLELGNRRTGGARVAAHRTLQPVQPQQGTSP